MSPQSEVGDGTTSTPQYDMSYLSLEKIIRIFYPIQKLRRAFLFRTTTTFYKKIKNKMCKIIKLKIIGI